MIDLASTVLLFVTFAAFAGKRGMTYMHVYQQEEYDSERLLGWIWKNKTFDKRLSLMVAIAIGTSFILPPLFVNFLIFTAMAVATYREKDPRKDSKKKLVATARAKRIFFPAYALSVLAATWCFLPLMPMPWVWLINIQLIPFTILFVNMLLWPFEEAGQRKFWTEAHNKIRDYQPTVIGITGSYGKTSVKHILGHILKNQAKTLVTPGSVNTPMGISRIIREELEDDHKYLIVEMGAYGHGSIERLCKLAPPEMGIITSIGHAHYERFKSLDAVAETKYELAQSVVARGGQMIVHERTLRFKHSRVIKEENENQFIVCGEIAAPTDNAGQPDQSALTKGDLQINNILQNKNGLEVRFEWRKVQYNVEVPLFGIHHGHNIALAFAAAFELGVTSADIQAALLNVPQIQHRLEVRKQAGGLTIIDDAYNSNPLGFQSAIGLLSQLGTGRKILITPGMVELGKIHNEAHKNIGKYAGEVCDIVIVVKGERIPTFIEGFKETGASKTLEEVESFDDAQKWVAQNKQDGDVILIENDLPDIYERVPKI